MAIELRFLSSEMRADSQGDEMALAGYAALFNSRSKVLGRSGDKPGFVEIIQPGAFTRSLERGDDVHCLFNHDSNLVLGRTKNGTLTLAQDDRGLKFRCLLDPTNQAHRNLYASIKRGDIDEMSFAFTIPEGGQQWSDAPEDETDFVAVRTISSADLKDVSPVTVPAYPGTSVGTRGEEITPEMRSAIDARIEKRSAEKRAADEQSLEDKISCINEALRAKFPADENDSCSCGPSGKFYSIETYPDNVIVAEWATGKYFRISYHIDTEGVCRIGDELQEVEQTWVPAERSAARVAELRNHLHTLAEQHAQQAAAHKDVAAAHAEAADVHQQAADAIKEKADKQQRCMDSRGDCEDGECDCQNVMYDPDDLDDEGNERSETEKAELRSQGRAGQKAKVRTKTVGGKHLSASAFAYVGDPEKTETWKLPIHDADHVRNALARFNQTEGIPAEKKAAVLRKIKAAAAKFEIEVSDDDTKRMLAGTPMDADEIWLAQVRARQLINS